MQIVCAAGLRARLPAVHVAIHAPLPSIDTAFYARRQLQVVPSSRRKLVRGTLQWARMAAAGAGRTSGSPFPPMTERALLGSADLVVDLSGDMLTEDYGVHVAYSHYLPLLQTLAASTPLAICAQSVGPFRHTRRLAHRILSRARLITLRERRSLEHVHALGIAGAHVEVTADLAFALEPASAEQAEAALARACAAGDRGTCGAAPSGAGDTWIGVSMSALVERHRRRAGTIGTLTAELAVALDTVAAYAGARILLIPHVYGPKPAQDDRHALRALRAALSGRPVLLEEELEPEVLKAIISRCLVFVGARMHAVMAALSAGVPVLALAYSHKAAGIMSSFDMDDWVLDAAHTDRREIAAGLQALIERRAELSQRLSEHGIAVRAAAERNLDLLAGVVAGSVRS
jgi:colanic acid/amylovoran biosynthesis protein